MKELLEKAEIKGIDFFRIHCLLTKYGFQIWVSNPAMPCIDDYYIAKNKKVIEQASIELDFMV